MSSDSARIQARGPAATIAVVPHLLGFHPVDSLVLIGVTGPHARIRLAFRYDLPDPPDQALTRSIAEHAVMVFGREQITTAIVIGYGPGTLVTPVTDVLRHQLPRDGVRLIDVLRVQDSRFWSYLCTDTTCCPVQGRPVDPDDPVATALAELGLTAVASRDDIGATIAPVTGATATAMSREIWRAAGNITRIQELDGTDEAIQHMLSAMRDAITFYRDGGTIRSFTELAALTLSLRAIEVRDDAWARMAPDYREAHLRLWTDITRHAQPGYIAAPASLLAFTAWQDGQGVLANFALDRAQADDPDYTMAQLLRDALTAGLPPSAAVLPMTPEEVAASYNRRKQQ
jgi:Domain of unknown function (DUF4192)